MAAKKAKGWRSGKREVRPRMVQMTRHLVVTEGKETEPRYFEGVRAALCAANERKVAVIVKGTGKHTLDLLDFAHMTQSAVKSRNGPADRLQSVGGACR